MQTNTELTNALLVLFWLNIVLILLQVSLNNFLATQYIFLY